MNLYHKKQRWKLALVGIAVVMVAASLWFSSQIVKKVQDKELDRVQQWADAVKRKSELVNLTNSTFNELSASLKELQERDRKKVEMWSLGIKEVSKTLDDYSFAFKVMTENGGMPMILTDMQERIVKDHNMGALDQKIKNKLKQEQPNLPKEAVDSLFKVIKNDSLESAIAFWRQFREPIVLNVYENEKQKIFYFDSIYYRTVKLEELQRNRDSLSQAFTDELIENDHLVPVMFIDKSTREVIATNIQEYDSTNTEQIIDELAAQNNPIAVKLSDDSEGIIYFEYSPEITQMKYFPYVQFLIIGLFVLIAYVVFSTYRKAEQDQVWVGMAKETAHQLGTPISSLMAWNQLLEAQGVDASITKEIDKDIERLSVVTNRFSKIGSEAILEEENMVTLITDITNYLRKRISSKIELVFEPKDDKVMVKVNKSLMEWVFENISKNAVDAMDGKGKITFSINRLEDEVFVDIIDTGKGIPANKLKTVFQPGYTTKKRGWGLGLSLVKRIVEDFHKGKVVVLKSDLNEGTTFRITLKA
ncbi:sensor histidine kinase [Crocinitomix algicola]|uniref:sensor histidine kinase n=1 Tax=Crocinitomix algicola TaxID=1740263 RepID=UPI0009F69F48|nr:HAMP domain-containing sensor histidine kinase [Crocinitomix algicola]